MYKSWWKRHQNSYWNNISENHPYFGSSDKCPVPSPNLVGIGPSNSENYTRQNCYPAKCAGTLGCISITQPQGAGFYWNLAHGCMRVRRRGGILKIHFQSNPRWRMALKFLWFKSF